MRVQIPHFNCLIDNYITDCPLVGGIATKLGKNFFKVISIRNFPGDSVPGLLDKLNRTNIEYRWNTRYISLDKLTSLKIVDSYMKTWDSKKTSLKNMAKEILMREKKDEDDFANLKVNEIKIE